MPITANLVVYFDTPQSDIHEKLIDIMNFYDGNESIILTNGDIESIKYYWHDVPSKILNNVTKRLAAEGVRFKILPLLNNTKNAGR